MRTTYSALCNFFLTCAMLSAIIDSIGYSSGNGVCVCSLRIHGRRLYTSRYSNAMQQGTSLTTRLHMAKGKKGANSDASSSSSGKKGFTSKPASTVPSATGEGLGSNSDESGPNKSQSLDFDSNASEEGGSMRNNLKSGAYSLQETSSVAPDSFNDILRVADPLGEKAIPPEIVFFGEPRQPPPVDAAREVKYHGTLLLWARHATVAPRNSEERLATVYPKGAAHPQAATYRLDNTNGALTFKSILDAFTKVMDDLEASKAFLNANMDIVPSNLFLRALTARKLSLQSGGDVQGMDYLKTVRDRYMIANDQLFFPLNIEVTKAETRVMTYLARSELSDFSASWDTVECSLHFTTLVAARLTWDERVQNVLERIKAKLDDTVEYMVERLKDDLMNREFRKPGLTAQVYANASKSIEQSMPDLYNKVNLEVRFLHEVYDLLALLGTGGEEAAEDTLRKYASTVFCPRNSITAADLLVRLRLLDATLSGIEDVDYIRLRLKIQLVVAALAKGESALADVSCSWYHRLIEDTKYGFETYEPDEVPDMIKHEQRIRATGSAFDDFAMQVLAMPIKYTEAFSGMRKKASEVGNWLFSRDKDNWDLQVALSYDEKMEEFRKAYMEQTRLRKEAEAKLSRMVTNRMDLQDRTFTEDWGRRVATLSDE